MALKLEKKEINQIVLTETFKIIDKEKLPIKKEKNISLTGNKTQFDSVALITLISNLERNFKNNLKKNIIIADTDLLNNMQLIKDTNNLSKHISKKMNAK